MPLVGRAGPSHVAEGGGPPSPPAVARIRGTVITVLITVLIGVMKTFDIVYVMTNGNFDTNIIAVDFYNQLFTNGNTGYAAAIVVMLMVAIIPIMIYQVRQFRAQEAQR